MEQLSLFWPFVLGAAGLIVGSFVALVTVRLPLGEGLVAGRSRCRSCGRTLAVRDLVPVLSYVLQRGRCRTCHQPVSPRYPAIEVGCALLGVWAGLVHPGTTAAAGAALGWALLLIAIIDGEHFWLPDRLTLPLLAAGLLVGAFQGMNTLLSQALGAAVGWSALVLLAAAYRRVRGREGLGGGDPRLLGAAGAWVGWMGLPSVLIWASAAGLSVVAARLVVGGTVRGDDRLPFGTFLAVGTWLTWLYGPIGR